MFIKENYMTSKAFWRAAANRAIRTVAQTAIATIGTAAMLSEVNIRMVLSASALAGILSLLTSIATGLPEATEGEQYGKCTGDNHNDDER